MRVFISIILLFCSFTFVKCQHKKVCLASMNAGINTANALEMETDACQVQGDILSKSEIMNLRSKKCNYSNDDVIKSSLNWLRFRNNEIIGLEKFAALCRNRTIGQLVWTAWNKNLKLLKSTESIKMANVLAKVSNAEGDIFCSLNLNTQVCKNIFADNSESTGGDFLILIERRPIRYELKDMVCQKGNIIAISDVDLATVTLTNVDKSKKVVKANVTYNLPHRFDLKLEDIPLEKDVPFQIRTNNSIVYLSSDGYVIDKIEVVQKFYDRGVFKFAEWVIRKLLGAQTTVSRQLKVNSSEEVVMIAKEMKKRCEAKAELIQYYDGDTFESGTIFFKATETIRDRPREKNQEKVSTYNPMVDVVVPVVVIVILIFVCACISWRFCGDTNTWLVCLCCCGGGDCMADTCAAQNAECCSNC